MLYTIREAEGTNGKHGYTMLYGGSHTDSLAYHPNRAITSGHYTSTAAGAYQALSSTWKAVAKKYGLHDFSPHSQDLFAVAQIAARGALRDVLAGNTDRAFRKLHNEWTSLPGGTQQRRDSNQANRVHEAALHNPSLQPATANPASATRTPAPARQDRTSTASMDVTAVHSAIMRGALKGLTPAQIAEYKKFANQQLGKHIFNPHSATIGGPISVAAAKQMERMGLFNTPRKIADLRHPTPYRQT